MSDCTAPPISQLIENPVLLNELETEDLFSLRAALQEDDDPRLDDLWTMVLLRTSSLEH
jgi:hypothetical protein